MLARALATPLITVPPLRPLLRLTSNAVRPLVWGVVAMAQRAAAFFWLVASILMLAVIAFIQRETILADLSAIAVTSALAYACFAVARSPSSRKAIAIAANGLLVATLALDWNAFGAYWAVALTLLAASVGVALVRRNAETSARLTEIEVVTWIRTPGGTWHLQVKTVNLTACGRMLPLSRLEQTRSTPSTSSMCDVCRRQAG